MINSQSLYGILLLALIPILLVAIKMLPIKRLRKEQEAPNFIKFQINKGYPCRWLVLPVTLILAVVLHFSFFSLLFVLLLCRESILSYSLFKYEEGRKVIYDFEGGLFEYKSGDHISYFKMQDIKSIVLHEYWFTLQAVRIADLNLDDKTIRISSALVNFNSLPILDPHKTIKKSYYFKLTLPELESRNGV